MKVALLIVAAVALLGLLLGPLLRRLGSPLGFWFSFVGQTLLRLTAGVILAAYAVILVEKGGWFIVIAVVLAVVATCSFALSGFLIWAATKVGFSEPA